MLGSDKKPQNPPQEEIVYQQAQTQAGGGMPMGVMPDMGRGASREYSESHYKFLSTLIESESAKAFFKQIIDTDFSHQAVNAFYKILTSGFDKNAILAANKNIEIRKIDFEIALNLMVLECHESDIQNPAFLTFRENIKQTFNDFISRSQNAEERKRLLMTEYGTTYREEPLPKQPGQPAPIRMPARGRMP